MTVRQLFLNQVGRLRSGWRLLIFLLVYISLLFILGVAARVAYAILLMVSPGFAAGLFLENLVFRGLLLVSALIAGFICTRWLEGLPWRALGLSFHKHWLRDFLLGSVIGVLSLALAALIAAVGGGLRFTVSGREMLLQVLQTLVLSAVLFILAALAEEALLRGYPLQTLTRAGSFTLGAMITSVAFAALHFGNPNFKLGLAFANLVIAGLWFAMAFWRTRSLWFPWGIHWAWNWALGSLFGLPVSGITDIAPNPLLHGIDLGPAWLTGGNYGIEGGIACTVALIISTIFIWIMPGVNASGEMVKLTSTENPLVGAEKPISIIETAESGQRTG